MKIYYFFIFLIGYLTFLLKIKGKETYQFPIFQSNECKPNKLAITHPKYDSHLTWVLSPECDLAIKYNWDVGIFLKSFNDQTTPSKNLKGYCSDRSKMTIFTNFDNGTLFIIFSTKKNNKLKQYDKIFNVLIVNTIEFWNSKIPYINILHEKENNITFIKKLLIKDDISFQSCIGDKNNVTINVICIYEAQKYHYQYFLNSLDSKVMNFKKIDNMNVTLTIDNEYFLHYYKNTLYILYWSVYMDDEIIYAYETEKIICKKINECHSGFRIPIYKNDDIYYYKMSSIKNFGITLDICTRISTECKSYFLSDNKLLDPFVCTHAKSFNGFNYILSGIIPIANPYTGLFSSMSSDSCSIKKEYVPKKYIL